MRSTFFWHPTTRTILTVILSSLLVVIVALALYASRARLISQSDYIGTILFARNGDELWLMDGNGTHQRKVVPEYTRGPSIPWDAASLSNDAQKIAYFKFPNIEIVNRDGALLDTIPVDQPAGKNPEELSSGVYEFAWAANNTILDYIVSTYRILPKGDPVVTYTTYRYDIVNRKNNRVNEHGTVRPSPLKIPAKTPDTTEKIAKTKIKDFETSCAYEIADPTGDAMLYGCETFDAENSRSAIYRINRAGQFRQLTSVNEAGINADTPIDWK